MKHVVILILFLSITVPQTVLSQENVGIKIESWEEPQISNSIVLKIIFTNPFDNWVELENMRGDLKIGYSGPGEEISEQKTSIELPDKILIPPRDKIAIYIPLEEFNRRLIDDRIGQWNINFKISSSSWGSGLKCYNENTFEKISPCPFQLQNNGLAANTYRFDLEKEESEVGSDSEKSLKSFWNFINENPILSTVVSGIILIVVGYFFNRRR